MRLSWWLIFISLGFVSSFAAGQTGDSGAVKNPVSYKNVLWSGQLAQFTFTNLGERKVVRTKKMTFYAPEKVEMDFRIKIKPDGTVSYVAPPRVAPQLHEFRLGGTAALYGYGFATVPDAEGDQWVTVHMTVGE